MKIGGIILPRNKEQNEEIRRLRREEILKAALKVYVEKGYAAAEIGDVANQAGLARGLIYYYYKDKLALFRELFQFMVERSNQHVQDYFSKDEPALATLEGYARSLMRSQLETPEYMLFFMRMRHDLFLLFDQVEMRSLQWPADFMQQIIKKMESGIETSEIRKMSPTMLAMQYWGSVMQAMRYLQDKKSLMETEGKNADEITEFFQREIEDAITVCMAIVQP
jgi:TetR/AcrR family transcriptional regulator